MLYGYEEIRTLDRDDLRSLCINQNWCTCADNEEYSNLLNMSNKENITTDDIVEIATIIYSQSRLDNDHDMKEHFSNICFLLFKTCNTFIKEIFEEFYNKGNDCDACGNQYICGLYGDAVGCKCKDMGLPCDFVEGVE